jgi:DNA polymerase II small subunit/DNA polymerase delta subunit B
MYGNRRIYNLVGNHKNSDIVKGIYEKENHITTQYLLSLKNYNGDKCYHCRCELDWGDEKHLRRNKQVTLQRLDNTKGHVKGNVVYACFECNVKKRMENKQTIIDKFETNKKYNYEEIRAIILATPIVPQRIVE